MQYENILFDLDGTLTDPAEGITGGFIYALDKYGIHVEKRSDLYKVIGPPLMYSFINFFGFDEKRASEACLYYREYYSERGKYENKVYDGIEECLQRLSQSGKKLIVATSKPEFFARDILEHFGIAKYFYYIAGSTTDGQRTTKYDVVKYAVEVCGIKDISSTIMVGDRKYDAEGARQAGIDTIGVLYGYGDRSELEEAGVICIAETPHQLGEILLGHTPDGNSRVMAQRRN